jgi:Nuclease-related domain
MTDMPTEIPLQWLLLGGVLVLLLAAWAIYRRLRRLPRLQQVLTEIAYDRIDGLLIPNGDEGEIQIDHLLLTSQGLLILDVKDVVGKVFGSDKMQEWTVISADRRYTFPNPQAALYDRIAAVRQIVRQVPVAGRLLFLDSAEFTKGVPGLVTNLDALAADFGEPNKAAARVKIEAFEPHWDLIRRQALPDDRPRRDRRSGSRSPR